MSRRSVTSAPSVGGHGRWDPATVVGIDFGMTCTGVAYASKDSGWARPEVIQDWPDLKGALFDKYPSRVAYNQAGRLADWGACDVSREISRREREFKMHLNPSFQDSEGGLTHEDAVKFYIDYMTELRKHIDRTLSDILPRWMERNVEYRFSIPTTWKSPALTQKQKSWLANAGFANNHNRRVVFSHTEAEAAAVYVADYYKKDDVIMIVDAGGATTDLNILKVEEKTPQAVRMRALDKAEGVNIGSVMIDQEVRRIVEQKLRSAGIRMERDTDLKWMAEAMMERSGFELFKCKFGNDDGLLDLYMEVPGRPGRPVILKSSELEAIFDVLIRELIKVITPKLLAVFRSNRSRRQAQFLVLSGGLGASPRIKERLQDEFCSHPTKHPDLPELQILVADEPQLAVVKGLVMDRSQGLGTSTSPWTAKCSRVSYGVLCKHPYSRDRFAGEPTVKDPLTGSLWVEDQIEWLIKEGSIVPTEGITKTYSILLAPEERYETFRIHVVMSELPVHALPRSRHRGPVTKICTVEGTFTPEDFETGGFKKVRSIFHSSRNHEVAKFNLKIIVGSADLAFQFVSLDGTRIYSQANEQVNVIWDDVQPAPQPLNRSETFAYPPSIYSS